jgi:hypothetical protein
MVTVPWPPTRRALLNDFDANIWTVVYTAGPRYVRTHARQARDAFMLAPATVYEVLFGTAPALAPLAEPVRAGDERVLCTDRLGVVAVLTVLARADARSAAAEVVVHAWRGDRLDVIDDGVSTRTTWTVAFADSVPAALFHAAWAAQARLGSATRGTLRAVVGRSARSPLLDSAQHQ